MKRWHTREDSGIVLDAEGRWWHDGERVEHPKVAAAFDAGLRVADDGRFTLVVGDDWCLVQVQGAAYRVIEAWPGATEVELQLSDGTRERMDPQSLTLDGGGVLNCRVKGGRALARFSRAAQVRVGNCLERRGSEVLLTLDAGQLATGLPAEALDERA